MIFQEVIWHFKKLYDISRRCMTFQIVISAAWGFVATVFIIIFPVVSEGWEIFKVVKEKRSVGDSGLTASQQSWRSSNPKTPATATTSKGNGSMIGLPGPSRSRTNTPAVQNQRDVERNHSTETPAGSCDTTDTGPRDPIFWLFPYSVMICCCYILKIRSN